MCKDCEGRRETDEEFLERIKGHYGEPLPPEDRLRLETLPKTFIA